MAAPKDRTCFYCKQSFSSSVFHVHLKHCDVRKKMHNKPLYEPENKSNYNKKQSLWTCPICTFQNIQSAQVCIVCQQESEQKSAESIPQQIECWRCNQCTFINNGMNARCDMCSTPNPNKMDDDAGTIKLIEQYLCVLCKKNSGFELSCNHNICKQCAKEYILEGIKTEKWRNKQIICPFDNGCTKNGVISDYIIKECGLLQQYEEYQQSFIICNDPSITSCPKCKETYYTEVGDMKCIDVNEKSLNGEIYDYKYIEHKAQNRFRCSNGGCNTIFCKQCMITPYHMGYLCDEYKQYIESKKCRFCDISLNEKNTAPKDIAFKSGLNDNVCNKKECMDKRDWSCDLKHSQCGHNCIGLRGYECMPCLNKQCLPENHNLNDEMYCNICWVDPLRSAPSVQLECGHYFHFMCLYQKIKRKWPAARITFGFLNCPLCKKEIHHPALQQYTAKYCNLKKEIQCDAIERVKIEGLENDHKLTDESSAYYNDLAKYAMDRLAFYLCDKCKKPYFGGLKQCEEAGMEQSEEYNANHLICGWCASGKDKKICKVHGKKYITYKCKYCCSISSWFCWGNTHFCDDCHSKQENGIYLNRKPISELPKCAGKDKCPLGVEHPPNGTAEYSLGCVVCLRK